MAKRTNPVRKLVDVWIDLFDRHDLLTYASAIAVQALVAEISLLLLGLGLLGATGQESVWDSQIGPQVQPRVLQAVYAGMDETVQQIFLHGSAGLIVFATLLAIWEVSGVVRAFMGSLNRIYETDEDRPWQVRFPLSFALAVAIIVALLGSVLLVVAGRHWVHGGWGLPFAAVRWLGSILLLGTAFGVLVRYAPAKRRATKWATVGATLVVVSWLVEALVFRWYITSLANFKSASGSLTVFLVVTSYLYVGAIIVLVGIELDELLRKDATEGERGILELVRALF